MGFKLKQKPKYPRRLWAMAGFPYDGKSTFATQMKTPILPIDADHRFDQVMHLVGGEVYEFGEPSNHVLVDRIVETLYSEMPEEAPHVGTIVVDSLTEIVVPIIMQGMADNANKKAERAKLPKLPKQAKPKDEDGEDKYNFASAFIAKSIAMKRLQSAVSAWGTDVLWVYHLQHGKNHKGVDTVTTSIPPLELGRLTRSLNARLRVVYDEKEQKRGIYVEWSRGRDGFTMWDTSGYWQGMPEKLEAAMYDDLDEQEYKKIPTGFKNPEQALVWAVEYGAFVNTAEAKLSYDELKANNTPVNAQAMWELWISAVLGQKEGVA